jgi:hypothetical protein
VRRKKCSVPTASTVKIGGLVEKCFTDKSLSCSSTSRTLGNGLEWTPAARCTEESSRHRAVEGGNVIWICGQKSRS